MRMDIRGAFVRGREIFRRNRFAFVVGASLTVAGSSFSQGGVLADLEKRIGQSADVLSEMGFSHEGLRQKSKNYSWGVLSGGAFVYAYQLWRRRKEARGNGGGHFHAGERWSKVDFSDLVPIDPVSSQLRDIVDWIVDPSRFEKAGACIPQGILFTGGHGNGKTLSAFALAREANVPFFSLSYDNFLDCGEDGARQRVASVFANAKKQSRALVLVDDLHLFGKLSVPSELRKGGRAEALSQIISEMKALEPKDRVLVIGTANASTNVEAGCRAAGVFEHEVNFPYPTNLERQALLKFFLRKASLASDVNLSLWGERTLGHSCERLAIIASHAVLAAAHKGEAVSFRHLDQAQEEVCFGKQKSCSYVSEDEKRSVAYHEAGHALVAILCGQTVYKASIIPRVEGAQGFVFVLPAVDPDLDRSIRTKDELMGDMAMYHAGYLAERIVFGDAKVLAGSETDIKQATAYAYDMVASHGMSDLGALDYQKSLGNRFGRSAESRALVDQTVREITGRVTVGTQKVLEDNRTALDALAAALLEKKTLCGDEVLSVVRGAGVREGMKPWGMVV